MIERLSAKDYDAANASVPQSPINVKNFEAPRKNSVLPHDSEEGEDDEIADIVDFDGGHRTNFRGKLKVLDGPGLGPEPARMPSTTNLTSTLFRLKNIKERFKVPTEARAGRTTTVNSLANSFRAKDTEAVVLQKKSAYEIRLRYLS